LFIRKFAVGYYRQGVAGSLGGILRQEVYAMAADIEVRRMVLREISKRHLDTSRLDVQVFHGVVYLRGTVSGMRGHDIDIKAEMEIVRRILRQRPGVRDVVVDLIFR